jgi:glycosyltransferase involved in cell wall biosynthesis
MRILFLLPDFPYPPSTGGRKKVLSILQFLSSRHHCDLLCLSEITEAERRGMAAVLPHVGILGAVPPLSGIQKFIAIVWHLMRLLPPSMARFSVARYKEAVTNALESGDYDVVHYDIVNMAQFIWFGRQLPSVHSPNDATSNVYFRLARSSKSYLTKVKLYVSAFLLMRYEKEIYKNFTTIHVVSNTDREYLHRLNRNLEIDVIPISSGYAYEVPSKSNIVTRVNAINDYLTIVVCGNFGDTAIRSGLSEIMEKVHPRLQEKFKNLRFRVLGRNIPRDMHAQICNATNAEYFSWIEDFDDFIREADVVLLPDMAGAPGAKTRVVQAMALGSTVVGTRTALEGVPLTNGIHGVIYESVEECTCALITLLGNTDLRREIGLAAASLAANEYSLDRVGPMYEALYVSAVEKYRHLNRDG